MKIRGPSLMLGERINSCVGIDIYFGKIYIEKKTCLKYVDSEHFLGCIE